MRVLIQHTLETAPIHKQYTLSAHTRVIPVCGLTAVSDLPWLPAQGNWLEVK